MAGFEARAFRGCGIFTSEPFEVSDDADSVQMLTRSSQIGEFYVMSPPQVEPENPEHVCDLLIYDEESDRHVRITWEDALKACCIDDSNADGDAPADGKVDGNAKMSHPTEGMGNTNDLKTWYSKAYDWVTYSKSKKAAAGGAAAAGGGAAAGGAAAGGGWATLDKDIRIVLARPFIECAVLPDRATRLRPWLTATRPAAQAPDAQRHHDRLGPRHRRDPCDRATRTAPRRARAAHAPRSVCAVFGPADMQLSANTQVKTIEGHYTGHFKAVVTKPQNVLIMRDVACAGYVAGCNTQFFALQREADNSKSYSLEAARQAMQDRLSFADDVGAKYGSMLAFPCTEGQLESNQGMDTVMSVTSRLLPWEVTGPSARSHSSFPGGEGCYQAYNNALGLDSIHYGEVRPYATQTNAPTRPLTSARAACACAGYESS